MGSAIVGSAMKSNQSAVAGGIAATPAGGAERAGQSDPGRSGLGQSGLGASGGQRLPAAPRERKPTLAALAVLLILGGALTSAYLVMASGHRVAAIRIAQPVAAGQPIPARALEQVQVSDTGASYYIDWSARDKVTSAYAAVPLVKGALLTNSMLVDDATSGRVVVGLALKPGQYPSTELDTGRRVSLYSVGGGDGGGPRAGTVLSKDAIVVAMSTGGDDLRGERTSVDVAVPPDEAAGVAQAASAGAIAVAVIPEGTQVSGGAEPPPAADPPAQPDPQDPAPGATQGPARQPGQNPQNPQNGGQNGGQNPQNPQNGGQDSGSPPASVGGN